MPLFGTDGIRGRVGSDPITAEFASRLGMVLANLMTGKDKSRRVCIGRDTRRSGVDLQRALTIALIESGASVIDLSVMPTPGISYCAKRTEVDFGIAITASHNPFDFNGFKIFDAEGEKLSRLLEEEIEFSLTQDSTGKNSSSMTPGERYRDTENVYVEFLDDLANKNSRTRLGAVIDCANGATTETATRFLDPLLRASHFIASEPSGDNINRDCGTMYPDALRQKVLATQSDLGIAFDGDGDRILLVDELGQIRDGDEVLYLLASYLQANDQLGGGVVGTQASNMGLELSLAEQGITFERTDVGDKYVYAMLKEKNWRLGGETSGHIIDRRISNAGDGLVIAMCVLELLEQSQQPLSNYFESLKMFPQIHRNIAAEDPYALLELSSVREAISRGENAIGSSGRVLVRASGTEPLVRIMVEHENAERAQSVSNSLAQSLTENATA